MPKFYVAAARDGSMMLKEIEADDFEEAREKGLREAVEFHEIEGELDGEFVETDDIEAYLDGFAIDQVEE